MKENVDPDEHPLLERKNKNICILQNDSFVNNS